MGHCYEFALDIVAGCGHAMTVAADGSACECPTCGARCPGRFDGCAAVLAQPGYVPLTAPAWAREHRAPTAHDARVQTGEHVIDLPALHRAEEELRVLTDSLRSVVQHAQSLPAAPTSTRDVSRDDLARLFEGIRHELDLTARRHDERIATVIDELDQLSRRIEAQHGTLVQIVDGLERLARRPPAPPPRRR